MKLIKGLFSLIDKLVKLWGYVSLIGIGLIGIASKFGVDCDHELLKCKSDNPPAYCGLCKALSDEYKKMNDKEDADKH